MFDKENIVNGVNVTECKRFKNVPYLKAICIDDFSISKCEDKPNCFYKQQQQQKKLEYEELEKLYDELQNTYLKQSKYLYRFSQALDEIKEYQERNCQVCSFNKTQKCNNFCQVFVILAIIKEVKNVRLY